MNEGSNDCSKLPGPAALEEIFFKPPFFSWLENFEMDSKLPMGRSKILPAQCEKRVCAGRPGPRPGGPVYRGNTAGILLVDHLYTGGIPTINFKPVQTAVC